MKNFRKISDEYKEFAKQKEKCQECDVYNHYQTIVRFEDNIKQNFRCISQEYLEFCEQKYRCKECSIYDHYKQVVLSEGNGKSPIFMLVCEAPGRDEVRLGRPLIGPAGQELRKYLREFGFTRENTILTNVMPCRPLDNKFPSDPTVVSRCRVRWLEKEIKLVKPKIIIACGAPAMMAIMKKSGVGNNRGRWNFLYNFQAYAIATWHPSYVLRCYNDPARKNVPLEFRNDLKKVATEWQFIYADRKLHQNKEDYKKNITAQFIKEHEIKMEKIGFSELGSSLDG